jgi:hypothetical protein
VQADRPESRRTTALARLLAVGAAAALAIIFLIGSTPDEEEFRFAILSAWLRVHALAHGSLGLWTTTLGLGIPQPFTPAFLLHPLLPLLAIVTPVTWVRVLLVGHVALGAAGMWRLTRDLDVSPLASALCVVTFLFATPTQNYVLVDFWPSHFIVWTTMPWIVWMLWRLLDADPAARTRWAIALGLTVGLVVANTNPGHVAVYAVAVVACAAARWRQMLTRVEWLALAVVIALVVASPTLEQVAHEWPLFDPRLPKWSLPAPLPAAALWNALASPLSVEIERTPFSRTLFFGGPFLVLAIAGAIRFARRHLDLVLMLAISAVLLFTSLVPLSIVSARYQFRDPLTLAAIPLAGLAFDRLRSSRARTVVGVFALQVVVLVAAAWPALTGALKPDALHADWFRGATADASSAATLVRLTRPAGRIVFSPKVDEEIYDGKRLWEGLGTNALAYRGLSIVDGWFKGVSTGSVWPDERMLYGRVEVPAPLMASPATLDVLGIRYVLADEDEPPPAGMRVRGVVPKKLGGHFVVYENPRAWPGVFVVDAGAAELTTRLNGCEQEGVLCRDLSAIARLGASGLAAVRASDGQITARFPTSTRARLLVVTQMFRRDWVASSEGGAVSVLPVFGGLIGVRLAPGVTRVSLQYRPTGVIVATFASWAAVAGSLIALLVLGARGRRGSLARVRPATIGGS